MHVFGRWEEAGIPGENPRIHGENMQTPHRKAPAGCIPYKVPNLTFKSSCLESETIIRELVLNTQGFISHIHTVIGPVVIFSILWQSVGEVGR